MKHKSLSDTNRFSAHFALHGLFTAPRILKNKAQILFQKHQLQVGMTDNRSVTHYILGPSHITDESFRIMTKYIQTALVNAVFKPLQNALIYLTDTKCFPHTYIHYLQAHKVSGRISPAQSLFSFPTGCAPAEGHHPVLSLPLQQWQTQPLAALTARLQPPAPPWHCWIRL